MQHWQHLCLFIFHAGMKTYILYLWYSVTTVLTTPTQLIVCRSTWHPCKGGVTGVWFIARGQGWHGRGYIGHVNAFDPPTYHISYRPVIKCSDVQLCPETGLLRTEVWPQHEITPFLYHSIMINTMAIYWVVVVVKCLRHICHAAARGLSHLKRFKSSMSCFERHFHNHYFCLGLFCIKNWSREQEWEVSRILSFMYYESLEPSNLGTRSAWIGSIVPIVSSCTTINETLNIYNHKSLFFYFIYQQ